MSTLPVHAAAAPVIPGSPLVQMEHADPLARALSRLHLSPFWVVLILAAYGSLHGLALPYLFGHLRSAQEVTGAVDDWPNLVILLLLVPLVIGYYAWQPAIIQAMYDGIAVRTGRSPAAAARAAELLRPLGSAAWAYVAIAIGLLECASWLVDLQGTALRTWQNANWVMVASLMPLRFVVFYSLVFMLVRQAVVLFGLNRFFAEFSVEIQPLHPDRAGGLRVLGDYVLTNGLVIGLVGLILGMGLLRARSDITVLSPEFYAELVVYFLAAPTVFFLFPLYSAHTRMVEAKQKLLAEIAEQFDLEYRVLLEGLRRDVLHLHEVERLEAIQKIYTITESSPDWPFNFSLMSKFGAAILLPVLAPLGVNLLANLFLK